MTDITYSAKPSDITRKWFLIDVVASIPYSLIYDITVISVGEANIRTSRWYLFFRLFRTLRLMRLMRVVKLQRMIVLRTGQAHLSMLLQMAILVASVIGFAHLFGCFWFFIGDMNGRTDESWVTAQGLHHLDVDLAMKYTYSLYFSIITITTVVSTKCAGET